MTTQTHQPDWNRIAEKFDMWVPHLAPVGETLIAALDVKPGHHVLDVACGTGEPALTLARRLGQHIELTAIDAAQGMVTAAARKAAREGLHQVKFACMPAEHITLPDASFDRVLCRFGVMLFENPVQGLKEMLRTLKPGGRFAYAVWHTAETMPTMNWSYRAFEKRVTEENRPPLHKVTSLGGNGTFAAALREAGYREFDVREHTFHYSFASFDEFWNVVEASEIMKQQFDALPPAQRREVRDEIALFARDFHTPGGLAIPHSYLVATGVKG